MKLEKLVEYSKLYELYSDLLSDKMKKIFSYYYFSDLTLSEISVNENISRQAVLDVIHKCEKKLEAYEESIKFAEYKNRVQNMLAKIENSSKIETVNKEIKTFRGEE